VNNINDQLDATMTILLIFESAQHVLGNHLPIFRGVRLYLQQCGVLSCCNIPHTKHIVYTAAPRTSNLLQH